MAKYHPEMGWEATRLGVTLAVSPGAAVNYHIEPPQHYESFEYLEPLVDLTGSELAARVDVVSPDEVADARLQLAPESRVRSVGDIFFDDARASRGRDYLYYAVAAHSGVIVNLGDPDSAELFPRDLEDQERGYIGFTALLALAEHRRNFGEWPRAPAGLDELVAMHQERAGQVANMVANLLSSPLR